MLVDSILLYKIGQFIALSLPLKFGYKFATFVSDLHYFFAKTDRESVTSNLKTIFPAKTDREIAKIRLKLFRNFAKYLIEFFRFPRLNSANIKKVTRVENLDLLNQALLAGKGVIILSAHIGNWELGGIILGLLGYPMWTVALPHKDKRVDDFFNSQREDKGFRVIPFGKAARQCISVLRSNEILALAGDRDFGGNGINLNLFGRSVSFPRGPAAFSLNTQAVIVPAFVIRGDDDINTLIFEEPIEFTPTGNRENDIKELASKGKDVIEKYIKKYPQQWFMFRKIGTE